MKTKRFLLAAVSCGMALYFIVLSMKQPAIEKRLQFDEAAVGSDDDPQARWKYEFKRLRDPATGRIPEDVREKEVAFASTLPTKEAMLLTKRAQSQRTYAGQLLSWSARGPYNVGGRTRALAIDASNETIMLAGGASGGMWRSTNGGSTWTRTTSLAFITQSVTCLAQDTRSGKTGTWYYGTGEFSGGSARGGGDDASYSGDGIYKSSNGGLTWNILSVTSSGRPQQFDNFFDYIWNIAIDPSNSVQDEVYAATYGVVWRSTNGGTTWTVARGTQSSPFSSLVDVAVTSSGVVYATLSSGGSHQGIWRSTDGAAWTQITPTGWPSSYRRIVIGTASSNQNVVYFLAETPSSGANNHSLWKYTYQSGDGSGSGGQWVDLSANIPMFGDPVGNFDSQNSYDLVIKVKPDNENVVVIGGTNLYRSTDGFATRGNTDWIGGYATANNISQYANQHPDQHSFVFLPSNPNVAFSGHDGGVSKTTNILSSQVTWSSLNNGYYTTQFYTIAVDHGTSGNNILIGGLQDNGTWFSNTASSTNAWAEVGSGDGSFCGIADGRSFYLYSVQNGKMYRSILNDNGVESSWTRVDPTGATGYLFINPFVLDPNDSKVIYVAGGDRLWRNSDITAIPAFSNNTSSVNWTQLSNSTVPGATVTALGISKVTANRLYYGTDNGGVYRLDGANSGDPSPVDVGTGKGLPSGAYVSCIAVDPTDFDRAMIVFSNYNVQSLFFTTNGGTNWSAVAGNLEQLADGTGNGPSCRWASILPVGGTTTYFVGTSTGLYSTSTLNGSSTVWSQEGATTIGSVVVDMIVSRQADGLVVAATHANGAFSATVGATLAAPNLNSPANGATNVATNTSLSWDAVSSATSYTVQVSTSSNFSSLVVNQSGITGTSYSPTGLSGGTTYHWRVSAENTTGTSGFSTARSFTTALAPPSPPTLAAPADGATGVSTSLMLSWNGVAGATSYAVQVSLFSNFAAFVVNQSGLTGTTFTASGLANGTIYFWRVSASNPGGTGGFSSTRTFTSIVAAPTAPTLAAPANGATGISTSPTLSWNMAPGADSYTLQISVSSTFDSFLLNQSGLTSTTFNATGLSSGTTYFWRVSATNAGGTSTFSAARSFTTSPASSVELVDGLSPKDFNLAQNYPNPFNPSTSIRFSLPKESFVRIMVLDAAGKVVRQLVRDAKSAGTYLVRWDGRDENGSVVASGVYFYRLESPYYNRTMKMVLLK